MFDVDTDSLIERAKAGDTSAQQSLLMRHHERLRRMISVFLDPRLSARVDPSDVLQDALTCAAARLPEYLRHQPVAFYPWLRQIVRNELIDIHRRHVLAQRRAVDREQTFGWGISDASAMRIADRLTSDESSPSQKLQAKERRDRVKAALSKLPSADRELLLMRCAEQLTVEEISEVLGISLTAVRSRLRRGLQKLSLRLKGMA
jgi:RNA polymerase sigma-70 factor (ECF subfamily)